MAVAVSHSSASSKLSSSLHSVKDSLFHQAKFAFTHQPFSTSNTLESEAYRGELSLLRQKSNQLEQIIDVMPTGMIMLDGDGIVIKTNKIASLLLDEPILGQAWFDVIRRSFKPRADDWHEVSLKDGRRVKLEITALGDQPGQLIMITDLTETRLLQDKLGHMQRLSSLGRLVSKLAMLYGANLKNKKLSSNDRSNFQDKLMSRLQDLEQQVNDMLLFSKSGKQQVVEPLSINELITDSVNGVEALVTEANAKISFSLCDDDCEILGNKRALSGAIENLIHNSLQVIRHDAEITITTYCQNEYAYISVKDNGQGIDKDHASKIFEPFYTSKAQGTGLGLAVVKSVANAHQGDVRLVSQPGEGAHFCIHLPILETNHVNRGEH